VPEETITARREFVFVRFDHFHCQTSYGFTRRFVGSLAVAKAEPFEAMLLPDDPTGVLSPFAIFARQRASGDRGTVADEPPGLRAVGNLASFTGHSAWITPPM